MQIGKASHTKNDTKSSLAESNLNTISQTVRKVGLLSFSTWFEQKSLNHDCLAFLHEVS